MQENLNLQHLVRIYQIEGLTEAEDKLMAKKGRTKGNKICQAGISWAKRTFDKYPSAYANMAASKYCKDPNYGKGKKKK